MTEKLKSTLKDNKYIYISGGVALFIILLVYFCYEIIPFGEKIIYRMDLYHQYGPLFSELYDRLTSSESLIYSWNSGLGSSFLGNFYNYLSSPISFIILIFGHENTFEAVAAMIAIKAVLSSMAMSYYLKKSQKANGFAIVAFGIMYAFCGYFVAYYWNVMWIDAMYILPFVVLGIEKIIEKGKCSTYIVALALAIFSNYYIGYMLCIFSCIYFIYYYFCTLNNIKNKKALLPETKGFFKKLSNSFFLKSGLRFAFSSLTVGIILLFMLIPLAYILNSSSATAGSTPDEYKSYFSIFDFLANHLAGLEPTIRSSGDDVLPNVYCGMLTVLLIPLYLFSKRISASEKITSVMLLAVMYFSFNINFINFFWHGFHFPNDLPYRQSFMYSFILLIMAFKALKNIDEYSKKQILAVGVAVVGFVIITQELGSKNVDDFTVFVTIAFTVLLTIVLGLIVSKKAQVFALSIMLICSVAAETISANTDHYVANQSKESFSSDYDDFKSLQQEIAKEDKLVFYREEMTDLRARMDPCWYDYNGASTFTSMAYEKVANFQKDFGLYGNKINSFTYNPQTPLYNAMFSLKYIYDKSDLISESEYYSIKSENNTFTAYQNNYVLNIGYPVSNEIIGWDASTYNNPVEAQEEYFKLATGIDGLYERIYDYEFIYGNVLSIDRFNIENETFSINKIDDNYDGALTVDITAKDNSNIYVYVYSRNLDTVSIFSQALTTTMTVNDGYILDLGCHTPGELISIEMPLKDDCNSASVDFVVFTVNHEKFVEGYNKLQQGQIEYSKFDETLITGSFVADKDEILYTSIPYDESWSVYIDGKRVPKDDIFAISDALIGVNVTEGEHEITFIYEAQGLKECIVISTLFIITLLIFYILSTNKWLFFKNKKLNLWQRVSIAKNNAQAQERIEEIIFFDNVEDENNPPTDSNE
ncbi:MAG: YfhO family protein [Clostridia bacterium]|nr:YfhO family protein [Clostridia bacterium]